TGGGGFIGSAVAGFLADQGHGIIALVRSKAKARRLADRNNLTVCEADITQAGSIKAVFKQHQPQAVIHTAWNGMTRDKRDDPEQILNLLGTQHVLQSA